MAPAGILGSAADVEIQLVPYHKRAAARGLDIAEIPRVIVPAGGNEALSAGAVPVKAVPAEAEQDVASFVDA